MIPIIVDLSQKSIEELIQMGYGLDFALSVTGKKAPEEMINWEKYSIQRSCVEAQIRRGASYINAVQICKTPIIGPRKYPPQLSQPEVAIQTVQARPPLSNFLIIFGFIALAILLSK